MTSDLAPAPHIATKVVRGQGTRSHLRWLADTYERVQRIRIDSGERLRAVLQGRIAGVPRATEDVGAGLTLARIRADEYTGPVPILARTYRLHYNEERELRAAMQEALDEHAAWPWLRQVRGIGPTLSARLLSRLDITRAPNPSSFWSYCGLATVPAAGWQCPVCNARRLVPTNAPVRWRHADPTGVGECPGRLFRLPGHHGRIAPRAPTTGERPPFDRTARRTCYQTGVSLLRAHGAYAAFYARQRDVLATRADWSAGHRHMAAQRKMVKLFLSHLWVVWTDGAGLETRRPYACAVLDHPGFIDPWSMLS